MKAIKYKGYDINLKSYKSKAGLWSPWSEVPLEPGGKITFMGKSFKTKKEADAHAKELAKDWIDHRAPNRQWVIPVLKPYPTQSKIIPPKVFTYMTPSIHLLQHSALRAATPTPSRDYSYRLGLHQASRSVPSSFSLLPLGIASM